MAAESSAHEVGYTIGQLLWLCIPLTVFLYQAKRLSDSGRSRFATTGLMLWAAGIFIALIASIMQNELNASGRLVIGIAVLMWFALQVGSIIMTVIGYYETLRRKHRKTGLNIAVWSTILSLPVVSLVGLAGWERIKAQAVADGFIQTEPQTSERDKRLYLERPEYNFSIEVPETGWSEFNPKKFNPAITVWVQNPRKQLNMMVIAEPIGFDLSDLSPFEQAVRIGLETQMHSVDFGDFQDALVGGRIVRRAEARGVIGIQKFNYVYHLFEENQVLYQLIAMANGENSLDGRKKELDMLVASFQILDDKRFPNVGDGDTLSQFSIKELGVSGSIKQGGWISFDVAEPEKTHLVGGAAHVGGSGIGVMAIPDIDPDESLKPLASGFLRGMEFELENMQYEVNRHQLLGGLPAYEYRFSQIADGLTYNYTLRVTCAGTTGIAVAGWWLNNKGESIVRELIEGLEIDTNILSQLSAPEGAPRRDLATMLNGIGLSHYNDSRYGNAMAYFIRAYEMNPEMRITLQNVAYAGKFAENYKAAVEFIAERIDLADDAMEIQVAYAEVLARMGRLEEAYSIALEAYTSGYVDDDELLTLIDIFLEVDDYERAVGLTRAAVTTTPSLKRTSWLVTVLRLSGDLDAAEAALKLGVEEYGEKPLLEEEASAIYLAKGEPKLALEVVDRWVETHGESVNTYDQRISALIHLDWLADAKCVVAEGLEVYPGNALLLDSQRWLLAQIGEDDVNLISKPIEPVSMPKEVQILATQASKRDWPENWREKSSVYDYRITNYAYDPELPLRTTDRCRVRVLDRAAMEQLGTLRFEFDRSTERIYINYIRVLGEDGSILWEQQRDSFYVAENSDGEMATDRVTVYAPVASLKAGSILEWETTWESVSKDENFPFKSILFASATPRKEQIVTVSGAVDQLLFEAKKLEWIEIDDSNTFGWRLADKDSFHWESNLPELTSFLPFLRLSAKGLKWESIVKDYYSDIEDKLVADETIHAVVDAQDLDGLSNYEKVEKLFKLMQNRVVYKALEFGSRGVIPLSARETWENRYGDCKDQTILMLQFLNALEIPAYPLLISTDESLVESMPSMDQFNHMIVYVPSLEEQQFIDVVNLNFKFGSGPPTGLGGRHGLVITEDGGSIVKLPQYRYSLEKPVAEVNSEIVVSQEDPEAVIAHEVLELNGYYGMWMRNTLLELDRDRYKSEIQNYINRYLPKGGEFRSVLIEKLKNSAQPIRLEVKYSFPLPESEVLEYRPLWEQYYLDMESSATRIHPYQLNYPFSIRSKVRCEKALALDFCNKEDHSKLRKDGVLNFRWEKTTANQKDKVTLADSELVVSIGWKAGQLSPKAYHKFFSLIGQIEEASARQLKWTDFKVVSP